MVFSGMCTLVKYTYIYEAKYRISILLQIEN